MPALLLKLAGLDITADGYRFASEEVKQTAFRLDGILSPPDDGTLRPTLFAEAQFQPDEDFYARFFSEIFLHLRQQASPRPWYAVVIYPNRITEAPPPKFCPMDYQTLQSNRDWLLLECVSGSHAYGLALPESDVDVRGVFVLPKRAFYGFGYTEQLADLRSDIVYYELKRYAELLCRNNPNLLELLDIPPDCLRYRHPLLAKFTPELFLSKRCEDTFAGYAHSQIKKARGLNKKILRPVAAARKSVLDFCYVVEGQGSVPLPVWLERRGLRQEACGLAAIPHFRDGYALFHDAGLAAGERFSGIVSGPEANEVSLSAIPKALAPLGILSFNRDGYSAYCREYREYWDWTLARNEARYRNTLEHGKNYDAKNMMHTFRLLHMALEIATEGRLLVRRPDRELLLAIRRGEQTYDDLVRRADEKLAEVHAAFANCALPEKPAEAEVEALLAETREAFYTGT